MVGEMTRSLSAPILHLRSLNPYVASSIGPSTTPSVYLPRITSSLEAKVGSLLVSCDSLTFVLLKDMKTDSLYSHTPPLQSAIVSGFAFQGTNACLVLEKEEGVSGSLRSRTRTLFPSPLWCCPLPSPMVRAVAPVDGAIVFTAPSTSSWVSELFDHVILGR